MSYYRKKPVVIEAIVWTGDNLLEVMRFCGMHPSASHWKWEEYCDVVAKHGLKIFTLEGRHMATIGDYIIKGVKGEFYPCKPDIFAMTYEDAASQGEQAKPLSDDEIWKNDGIMAANSGYGATFETLREVIRAVEQAHGIGVKE